MLFEYEALDSNSKSTKSVMDAKDEDEVISKLRALELNPISIKKTSQDIRVRKADPEQLLILTRFLGELLKAKIPLLDIFTLAKEEIKDRTLLIVIDSVLDGLKNGQPLSKILSRYPGIFSPLYRTLIKAGEETGKLDLIFDWNTKFLERTSKTRQDLIATLLYPAIVFIAALVLLCGVIFILLPQFEHLYSDLGAQLPLIPKLVFQVGRAISGQPLLTIVILVVIISIPFLLYRFKRAAIDRFLFNLPIVKDILFLSRADYFTYALGVLLQYKVPVNEALETLKDSFDNPETRKSLEKCVQTIQSGGNIGSALKDTGLIDKVMSQLLSAGEVSGRLDQILLTISAQYKQKLDVRMKYIMALLQPALILFLGLIIGLIVVTMFLPIFKLATFM